MRRARSVARNRRQRMGRRSVAVGGSPWNTGQKTRSSSGASVAPSPNSPAPRWGSGTLARCDRGLRPRLLTYAPYGAEQSLPGRTRPMNGQSVDRHEKSSRNSRMNPKNGAILQRMSRAGRAWGLLAAPKGPQGQKRDWRRTGAAYNNRIGLDGGSLSADRQSDKAIRSPVISGAPFSSLDNQFRQPACEESRERNMI